MAALKPIKQSVCKDKKIWQKICTTALTLPTSSQIERVNALQAKFSKVYKK